MNCLRSHWKSGTSSVIFLHQFLCHRHLDWCSSIARYRYVGTVVLVKTFTPTEPLMQRMEDRIYATPGMWNLLVKYVVMEANTQFKYVAFCMRSKLASFKTINVQIQVCRECWYYIFCNWTWDCVLKSVTCKWMCATTLHVLQNIIAKHKLSLGTRSYGQKRTGGSFNLRVCVFELKRVIVYARVSLSCSCGILARI